MNTTFTVIMILSLLANVGAVAYIVWLVKNLSFVSDNLNDMDVLFHSFEDHLTSIHEMEMFYGDATLSALIDHSRMVKEEIQNYREVMSITDGVEEIRNQDVNDETQEEE